MTVGHCEDVQASSLSRSLADHFGPADDFRFLRWTAGRSVDRLPWLQVIEAYKDGQYHYLTSGASRVLDRPGFGLEFCFVSRARSCDNVELLAMVAYMHSLPEHRLGVGHTLNVGRPIASGSALDRLLVSLPYPYGADFEYVHTVDGDHARILWLLPISRAEEQYRQEVGLQRLEELFEEAGLDYSDPLRPSVV
jgi:hypothetical protein